MTDSTEPSPPAPPRSRGGLALLWLLVLAQAGFSGWLYWQWQQSAAGNDQVGLEREIDALSKEVGALSSSAETNGEATRDLAEDVDKLIVSTDDLASIREQITALQAQTQKLEESTLTDERIASMLKVAEKIEAVNQRVEKDQQTKWRQIQLLSSLDTLESSVRSGKSYEGAYRAMYLAAGDQLGLIGELRPLEADVSRGIPTIERLQASYQEAISAYLAARTDTPNQTWSAVKRNLASLVTVRKVGTTHSGQDTESRIARAEALLAQGDVASAREETQSIDGRDAQAFASWLRQSKSHLAAEAALTAIREQIMLGLGG